MKEEEAITADTDRACGNMGERGQAGGPEMAGCCGPEMTEMMEGSPCAALLKKHRLAVFAILSLVILAFLISQVGGILGIIAFIRTL